jgi:hypothetical protein
VVKALVQINKEEEKMKRIVMVALAVVLVTAIALGSATAFAAKPQSNGSGKDVIAISNGFPSGEHFNLNIHGKKDGFVCDPTPGGGSVFVDEVGPATIQYVTNRKSSVVNLTVLDPCAVNGGTAKVQLPYEQQGYFVFGRILGKPNNGDGGGASSVILGPNVVVQACNDEPVDPGFGNYTSCDEALLALGLITNQTYFAENESYVRFDPTATKGKGKSTGTDITRLFTYVGWVVHEGLDIGSYNESTSSCQLIPDGLITECDVPADACSTINSTYIGGVLQTCDDFDVDGTPGIQIEEWLTFNSMLDVPMAWYFALEDGMWIFNIADLVVTEQGLVNDGTKLLQIRFYPVDTTEYIPN